MSKLYIKEYVLNETFHCEISLAELIIGEANWCGSDKEAYQQAYAQAMNTLHVAQDELVTKKILYEET